MSIVMNLYYTGENGSVRNFIKDMKELGIVERIKAEDGNERYDYFFSEDDPETILLIDTWRDQTALDEHHKTPMMEEILRLREKYRLKVRAERFISDDENITSNDQALIDA